MAERTVGRDAELTTLRRMIADVADSAGGCLVLSGTRGIGKSHLLREAIDDAADRGVAVAFRSALELDRVVPLVTLGNALRRCQPQQLVIPWLGQEEENRYRTVDLLGEMLENYAARQPLVIAIDDTQWMDELSGLAVRILVPALASSPVCWLFARRTTRSDEDGVIDGLIAEGAHHIELRPLDEDAVARLCTQVVEAEVDATVLAQVSKCDGSPFLIGQLLIALRASGQLVVADGTATLAGGELPSSFYAMVEQRLRGLTVDAQRLVRAGSVFGRPFSVRAVAKLLGMPPTAVVPAVEEVVAAGVLVGENSSLTFGHELLREAVYNTMQEPVRAVLHGEAAAVTRDEGGQPVEVAEHLLRGGGDGGREAVAMLRSTATAVAGRAPGTAADLIVYALDLLGEHDPDRAAFSAEAVGLLASAGRLTKAHELGEATLRAGLDDSTEATLLLGLAEAFKHAGQNRTAVDYADRALRRAAVPQTIQARLYAIRAHALFYADDMVGADRSGSSAHVLGAVIDEFGASVWGLTARSLVAHAQGRFDNALTHARQATEIADRVGGEAVHRHPQIWLGSALAALDRFDEAEQVYQEGRRESERLGTAWSAPLWQYYYAALLTARGDLDEAVVEAETGLHIAEQLTAYQLAVPLLGSLARLALARGEVRLAEEHLERMKRLAETGITAAPEDVTWTIASVEEASMGSAVALRTLTGMYDALPDRPVLFAQDASAPAALVRIAVNAGDSERAEGVVTVAVTLARSNPAAGSLAAGAAHAEGLLRQDPDRLREAVDLFRAGPRKLALAAALEDAATVGAAVGRRRQALEWWEEAIELTTACGARRAATRIDSHVRRLGHRRSAPAAPSDRPSLLSTLTGAERRVAGLVAQGLTNRAIAGKLVLSRHTIDSHLRHIFDKLGINSRAALAALVAREFPPIP